jgi:glutamine amidotransferase
MSTVAIVDSGGANIASLLFAFERLGVEAELTTDSAKIQAAERVLLPGVGAAKDAMRRLSSANLVDVIRGLEQPVLGICLGMQLLCDASEEENVECLGIVPGVAHKLDVAEDCAVPNMGWCATTIKQAHPVLDGIADNSWFYYLHSYAVPVGAHTLAVTRHSGEFSSVIGKDNFIAAQFHPERSSVTGAQLLRNFLEWQA